MNITKAERKFLKLVARRDRIAWMMARLSAEAEKLKQEAMTIAAKELGSNGRMKKLEAFRKPASEPIIVIDIVDNKINSLIIEGIAINGHYIVDDTDFECPVCEDENYGGETCPTCGYAKGIDEMDLYQLIEDLEFDRSVEKGDTNGK